MSLPKLTRDVEETVRAKIEEVKKEITRTDHAIEEAYESIDELENMNRCNHTELRRLQLNMGDYR